MSLCDFLQFSGVGEETINPSLGLVPSLSQQIAVHSDRPSARRFKKVHEGSRRFTKILVLALALALVLVLGPVLVLGRRKKEEEGSRKY